MTEMPNYLRNFPLKVDHVLNSVDAPKALTILRPGLRTCPFVGPVERYERRSRHSGPPHSFLTEGWCRAARSGQGRAEANLDGEERSARIP